MNQKVLTNGDVAYYGVKVNGRLLAPTYTSSVIAEQIKAQVLMDNKDNPGTIVEVVCVTADGRELLLG